MALITVWHRLIAVLIPGLRLDGTVMLRGHLYSVEVRGQCSLLCGHAGAGIVGIEGCFILGLPLDNKPLAVTCF